MHKGKTQPAPTQYSGVLEYPVTILKGINPTPVEHINLGTLFARMRTVDPEKRERVLALRNAAFEAKKSGDESRYKIEKEKSNGFLLGRCSYREDKKENFQEYVPVLGFDLDYNFSHESTAPEFTFEYGHKVFTKVCADPFTLAAFFSPSGGIRILVHSDCSYESHRDSYARIMDHYSNVTGLPVLRWKMVNKRKIYFAPFGIDSSCNNESRFFYFMEGLSEDEFYLNVNSKVFTTKLTPADRWELFEKMTDERSNPGGRNDRVFFLAQVAHEHGESEADILAYCKQYAEKDFTEREIKTTVSSAVKRTNGKFTEKQLESYAAKRQGSTPGSSSQSDGGVKGSTSGNASQSDDGVKVENSYTKIVSHLNRHYEFKLDVVSNELFARKKNDDGSWGAYGVLNENNILHELRQGGLKVSDSVLLSLLGSDYVKRHDPFVEYFKNLPAYDKSEGDHILKAAGYVRLKDESEREFFNTMYKKTLVRIAAAATLKISFNKQCFVLSGGQGGGKSTFVRWHCPPSLSAYRVDWTREEVNEKDGRFALAQNFMINLDELASFGKHNIEQTKALMSLDHIKDRPPYGKRPVRMSRRASFWGSTNRLEFLTDETGTRRWITFEIESIKHDCGGPDGYAANVNIDRVWAQAWHLLESGEITPELTEEETEKSESKNKFFAVSTFELEMLMKHFEEADSEGLGVQFCMPGDIHKLLETETGVKINRMSLVAAIKRLGWQLRSKRLKDKDWPVKGYFVRKLDIPGSAFVVEQSKPNEVEKGNGLPDEPPF